MEDVDKKLNKANFTDKVFGGIGICLGSFVSCPVMLVRAGYSFLTNEDPATRNAALDKIAGSVASAGFDIGKDVIKPGATTVLAGIIGANINHRS